MHQNYFQSKVPNLVLAVFVATAFLFSSGAFLQALSEFYRSFQQAIDNILPKDLKKNISLNSKNDSYMSDIIVKDK